MSCAMQNIFGFLKIFQLLSINVKFQVTSSSLTPPPPLHPPKRESDYFTGYHNGRANSIIGYKISLNIKNGVTWYWRQIHCPQIIIERCIGVRIKKNEIYLILNLFFFFFFREFGPQVKGFWRQSWHKYKKRWAFQIVLNSNSPSPNYFNKM